LSYNRLAQQVESIFFYRKGFEGFEQYRGRLPGGVTFNDSREMVRAKLGTPVKGGRRRGPTPTMMWDLFRQETYTVHVEFDENGSVKLITLAPINFDDK
jgi:hypothetical protein